MSVLNGLILDGFEDSHKKKESIFIECYTYRKSFGIEEFIGEIFRHIHPNITVHHTRYIKFSLPKNSNLESFLNDIFVHYTDTEFLQAKVKEAERSGLLYCLYLLVQIIYIFI